MQLTSQTVTALGYLVGSAALLVIAPFLSNINVQFTDTYVTSLSTLGGAALGSVVTYILLTQGERRKAQEFKKQIRKSIQRELNFFHNLIDEALKVGEPRPGDDNRLAIDRKSAYAKKFWLLNQDEPKIYERLDIETKIKTIDGDLILVLDQLFQDIRRFGLHIYYIDEQNTKESYLAVEIKEAATLRQRISDLIVLLG